VVANLPEANPSLVQWLPSIQLQHRRSSHPLDIGISSYKLNLVKQYCNLQQNTIIAYSKLRPRVMISTANLRQLISHGQPINDEIIYLFLEIYCSFFDYTFLTEKFLTLLKRNGWSHTQRYFADTTRGQCRSINKPYLNGEPAIAIPCFVNEAHWVAVARREIQGQVYFLYSDDLNNPSTEEYVKQTLSKETCPTFYPPTAKRINCKSYIYIPTSFQ
jgi:hypothetical protein